MKEQANIETGYRERRQIMAQLIRHQGATTESRYTQHVFNLQQAMATFEVKYILNILELAEWEIPTSARMLGITTSELTQKMERYRIKNRFSRPSSPEI